MGDERHNTRASRRSTRASRKTMWRRRLPGWLTCLLIRSLWGHIIYLDFIYWELAFAARNGRFFQIMVGVLCSMYSGCISASFSFFFDFLFSHLCLLCLVSMRFWICILSYTRCISFMQMKHFLLNLVTAMVFRDYTLIKYVLFSVPPKERLTCWLLNKVSIWQGEIWLGLRNHPGSFL